MHRLLIATFITLVVMTPDLEAASTLFFPQVAVGGPWRSILILRNASSIGTGGMVIRFFDTNGEAMPVTIGDRTQSSFTEIVQPLATLKFVITSSSAAVRTGYVLATDPNVDSSVRGLMTVQFVSGGAVTNQAMIEDAFPFYEAAFPHEFNRAEGIRTGIAIVNPNNVPLNLTFSVRTEQGVVQSILRVAPLAQVSRFTDEFLSLPASALGDFTIRGDDLFFVTGLRFDGVALMTLSPSFQFQSFTLNINVGTTSLAGNVTWTDQLFVVSGGFRTGAGESAFFCGPANENGDFSVMLQLGSGTYLLSGNLPRGAASFSGRAVFVASDNTVTVGSFSATRRQ